MTFPALAYDVDAVALWVCDLSAVEVEDFQIVRCILGQLNSHGNGLLYETEFVAATLVAQVVSAIGHDDPVHVGFCAMAGAAVAD